MFAKRLIDLREKNNIYQRDLANKLNVEQATISQWEHGKRVPDSEILIKLSKLFDVSIDYLLGNDKKISNKEQELKEIEIFKKMLIRIGYINNNENLSKQDVDRIMTFIKNNKEFIKK